MYEGFTEPEVPRSPRSKSDTVDGPMPVEVVVLVGHISAYAYVRLSGVARVCRVCKAHGPTATGGPTDGTFLYFL